MVMGTAKMLDSDVNSVAIVRFDQLESMLSNCDIRAELFEDEGFYDTLSRRLDGLAVEGGVLSLDVFDTLLIRDNSSELRRFLEIGKQLSIRYDVDWLDAFLARHLGTKVSYRISKPVDGCREGSLTEIYEVACRLLSLDENQVSFLIDMELDYERTRLTVNTALLRYADSYRKRGGLVMLLSDMYMHDTHIRCLLEKLNVDCAQFDYIFSSADTKISKASRKVFPYIQEQLNIPADQFTHVGDSLRGDYAMPISAGWRALHTPISQSDQKMRRADHNHVVDELKRQFGISIDISAPR